MRYMQRLYKSQDGFMLPGLISFIIAVSILSAAVITVVLNNFFVVGNNVSSQKAFNISEAGLNYYLWHLSHNATDFKDGQTTAGYSATLGNGPFVHDYIDDNGKKQGTFTLWIKPQGNGSTIATVRSIGKAEGSNAIRTTEAKIGAASFASYGVLADVALWFGESETATGPVFSNQGVRMDGPNTDTVASANATYTPPAELGGSSSGNTSYPGVWCSSAITAPVNCGTRDKTNWLFPQASVDFNQVSNSLCTMKKVAFASSSTHAALATQSNACTQVPSTRTPGYLPRRANNYNISRGYLVQLNNNNTYNLYEVNSVNDTLSPYSSALGLVTIATNIAIPSSGVIFAEDNVWVRTATTFSGRVSIGAGRLATNDNANITIADDVLYSTKNGTDAIGLVAENDVVIAPYAPPATGNFTFEVDAALLAQSGSVRYAEEYVSSNRCPRGWVGSGQKFVFYGSVASRQTWTWNTQRSNSCADAVYDSVSDRYYSGVKNTDSQYDYNLMYGPPPSYPITGGYSILSWREVLTRP